MLSVSQCMSRAREAGTAIPAFNIPYLPMMKPVIEAVKEQKSFALIEVARLEWTKFGAQGPEAISREFEKYAEKKFVRLHLDHIPVIDEDYAEVDYLSIIKEAIGLGYESVMVDGSRLRLDENIAATREVAELAHKARIACEGELGAVLGHEKGPVPPYEELFSSKRGFTDPGEARRFVEESGCDWLSVAAGSIHGAISGALKDEKKAEARLDVGHVKLLADACGIPLVLHGGSGIKKDYVRDAVRAGICKVNVGTAIRQPYEQALKHGDGIPAAQDAVRREVAGLISDYFGSSGSISIFLP